jgi:hypothetical protein
MPPATGGRRTSEVPAAILGDGRIDQFLIGGIKLRRAGAAG